MAQRPATRAASPPRSSPKLVEEKTGGEVKINIAGSEQLGNDVAMLTSLRTGALDLTANSQGAASGLVPELSALGLPFLFDNAEAAFQVLHGPVGEELAAKFAELGIITLDWWDNGIRHITTKEARSPSPATSRASRSARRPIR